MRFKIHNFYTKVNIYKSSVITCLFIISIVSGLQSSEYSRDDSKFIKELKFKAIELGLQQKRNWHVLLHYKPTLLGVESEIDSESFFLATDGRTNPMAELEATLSAFIQPETNPHKYPARCRYPARFDWLNQQLNFSKSTFPVVPCPKLEKWLQDIHPESLTLVFPGYYLQAPASMFGHTFLRINSTLNHEADLLAMAINYSAIVDPENPHPAIYIFKGVFGGFDGAFSVGPYYQKVNQYNNIEIRDIWEYDLNFSRAEIIVLLKHVWELKDATFNYYFFKENCSYHLLSLLEIARPSLNIQDSFLFWTIPVDTLKKVIASSNLVTQRRFRPSRWGNTQWYYQQLNHQEKRQVIEIIDKDHLDFLDMLKELSAERQSRVLDFLIEYYSMNQSVHSQQLKSRVLSQRASLRVIFPDQHHPIPDSWPDHGHDSSMVSASVGTSKWLGKFVELSYRPSYHDLLDSDTGFIPNSQIEGLHIKLRQGENNNATILEDLTLLKVISLPPVTDFLLQPSWKLDTGIRQSNLLECVNCLDFEFKIGAGVSYTVLNGTFYSLGELTYLYGDTNLNSGDVTPGINLGFLWDLFSMTKIQLDTTYLYADPALDSSNFNLAFNGFKNNSFRLYYRSMDEWAEYQLIWLYYF